MKLLMGLACRLRSWQYEIVGVIGLSAAVNIFTSVATSRDLPLLLPLLVSGAWLTLGSMSLWVSGEFRSRETAELLASHGDTAGRELSNRLLNRFRDNRQIRWTVLGIAVSLAVSATLSVRLVCTRG